MNRKLFNVIVILLGVFVIACNENPITTVIPQSYLASAFSLSDGRMWAVGANGNIFYSNDF